MVNKKITISLGLLFLTVIIFAGFYFFSDSYRSYRLNKNKNKLINDLSAQENKLQKEKEKLSNLMRSLNTTFPLGASIQEQMQNARDIVRGTNFMFSGSDSSNPKLKIKNILTVDSINKQRQEINNILLSWEVKGSALYINQIDKNEGEKIQVDMQKIENFLKNINELVSALTPENSGLSSVEIYNYTVGLPTVSAIEEIVRVVEEAIEDANSSSTSVDVAVNLNNVDNSENNNPESDSISPVSPSTENSTVSEVIKQQEVVSQAETEVKVLEEKITEVEHQIEQLISPQAPIPVVPTTSTPPIETETPVTVLPTANDPEFEEGPGTTYIPPRDFTPSGGIITQPGEPRLIQGSDPF